MSGGLRKYLPEAVVSLIVGVLVLVINGVFAVVKKLPFWTTLWQLLSYAVPLWVLCLVVVLVAVLAISLFRRIRTLRDELTAVAAEANPLEQPRRQIRVLEKPLCPMAPNFVVDEFKDHVFQCIFKTQPDGTLYVSRLVPICADCKVELSAWRWDGYQGTQKYPLRALKSSLTIRRSRYSKVPTKTLLP